MGKVKFSIIIPVYNAVPYLEKCLESVINQSFDDYEVIVVDDGSSDDSLSVCMNYSKSEKVKLIHKDNEGQLLARKRGISEAKGEYLCFVDSDDYIRQDSLEILNNVIENYDSDLICYRWHRMDKNGNLLEAEKSFPFDESGIIQKEVFLEKVISGQSFNSLCIKVFKKSYIDQEFDYNKYAHIKNGEDLLQSICVFEKAQRIYYLAEELYFYRTNDNSVSHSINFDHISSVGVVRPALYKMIDRMGLLDEKRKKLFFTNYLLVIWSSIQILDSICKTITEYKKQLNILYELEFVKSAASYIDTKLNVVSRIGLKLFYKRSYSLLKLYCIIVKKMKGIL